MEDELDKFREERLKKLNDKKIETCNKILATYELMKSKLTNSQMKELLEINIKFIKSSCDFNNVIKRIHKG